MGPRTPQRARSEDWRRAVTKPTLPLPTPPRTTADWANLRHKGLTPNGTRVESVAAREIQAGDTLYFPDGGKFLTVTEAVERGAWFVVLAFKKTSWIFTPKSAMPVYRLIPTP